MSTPALNPRPSARRTTTHRRVVAGAVTNASASSNQPATVSAFTGGASTTTSAMPSSTLAVRWNEMIGLAHRTISSTAVRGRSARKSSHWSGCSKKACIPWVMALRVVSLPATASSNTKNPNSSELNSCPSVSAWTSLVTMSSIGQRLRSSARFHA
jgi:hypothetical protein